ncbi:MAG: tetratricopeptide repeat protein [Myxococcota bacterium]
MLAWAAAPTVLAHPSALERVARLDSLIRSRPEEPRLYVQRAQAHAEDGHFDEALSDLHRAAALGEPVEVAYDLGVVHHRMGRLEEARSDFDRWLARHPTHAPALLQRAQTLRELGDRAAALADYEAYFERHPKPNPGDYLAAARMLATPDGSDPAGAITVLDAGMQRLGIVPTLQQEAIALERARGRVAAALDRLETLRPSLGASPDWKVVRGELLLEAGRREEGRKQLEVARAQLSSLRVTQARVALGTRIEALLEKARNGPLASEVARTRP